MIPVQTTKTNKILVDSSILIGAAIFGEGAARDVLRRGFRGDRELYISSDVLEESERNLRLKAPRLCLTSMPSETF